MVTTAINKLKRQLCIAYLLLRKTTMQRGSLLDRHRSCIFERGHTCTYQRGCR